MNKKKKIFIRNLSGLVVMVLLVSGMAYLSLSNDPISVEYVETGDPTTTLIKELHTKTGKIDYYFEKVDGMGNIERTLP